KEAIAVFLLVALLAPLLSFFRISPRGFSPKIIPRQGTRKFVEGRTEWSPKPDQRALGYSPVKQPLASALLLQRWQCGAASSLARCVLWHKPGCVPYQLP